MNTRDTILKTSLELFHWEGYESTGVQKIAERSGVRKPTLYHYFGNKRGLLKAILDEGLEPFWSGLEHATAYKGDITANLEATFRLYFSFAEANPIFYQWYLSIVQSPKGSVPGELVSPILERQCARFAQLFKNATEDHGNMKGRHLRYAFTCLGMIDTCITTSFYGQLELSDESAHLACKQFMHGIFS